MSTPLPPRLPRSRRTTRRRKSSGRSLSFATSRAPATSSPASPGAARYGSGRTRKAGTACTSAVTSRATAGSTAAPSADKKSLVLIAVGRLERGRAGAAVLVEPEELLDPLLSLVQ